MSKHILVANDDAYPSGISKPIRELIRQTERIKQGKQKLVEPLKKPVT